jgi:hypothetical protein
MLDISALAGEGGCTQDWGGDGKYSTLNTPDVAKVFNRNREGDWW